MNTSDMLIFSFAMEYCLFKGKTLNIVCRQRYWAFVCMADFIKVSDNVNAEQKRKCNLSNRTKLYIRLMATQNTVYAVAGF